MGINNKKFAFLAGATLLSLGFAVLGFTFWQSPEQLVQDRQALISEARQSFADQLGEQFLSGQFPQEAYIQFPNKEQKELVRLQYTFNPDLQYSAERILKSYRPDYGAIVIMNAKTGEILALSEYKKNTSSLGPHLALRGTYPAASIFKIVTATAALDKYNLSPETIILFNGSNHTLYKRNVMNTKVNRWTRGMTLREAFARSVNTVFGRLTFENLQPQDLEEYAIRFGFNQHIASDLPFDSGFTEIPHEKNYRLAEISSGFNRVTTMSPIQGAMIAASVAANGEMKVPYVIERAENALGQTLYQAEPLTAAYTMSPEGAERLKELMEATVKRGTSQKYFRPLVRDKRFKELEIGGKTGSLTGNNPRGKVDWFVGYAIGEHETLAIAALTVNVKYWTVKSSYLAQYLFKAHFKEQFNERNEKFFANSQSSDE